MFHPTKPDLLPEASRQGSVADQAHQLMLDAIVHGQLTSAQAVHDREWAAALGTSRTPIRDAIQRLNALGLLEVAPARFTRLRSFTPTTAHQEARDWAALHQAVVTSVAPAMTTALLDRLHTARHAYQQCIGDPGRYAANFAFFDILRGATPSFALRLGATAAGYRFRLAEPHLHHHPGAVTGLHASIIAALDAGTPATVHRAFTAWADTLTHDHALAA